MIKFKSFCTLVFYRLRYYRYKEVVNSKILIIIKPRYWYLLFCKVWEQLSKF